MKLLAALLISLTSLSAFAALTPTADSLRRIGAITTSAEVYKALGNTRAVTSITVFEHGIYGVVAGECAVQVKVDTIVTNPPQMVPKLKVTVGQVNCLP